MDYYPYITLRANGWLHCDGLHCPSFPTLLRDVLYRIGYTGTPTYRGCLYREFGRGCWEVHVDVPTHPSDPSMIAWFTQAMTSMTLWRGLPTRPSWSFVSTTCRASTAPLLPCMAPLLTCSPSKTRATHHGVSAWPRVGEPERPTYHASWVFTACYAQHVRSMLQEVTPTGTYQRLRLEEYDHQVEAKTRLIKDIQKGNQELLQWNHRLEMRIKELNDELMRTYHSRDVKTDLLDDAIHNYNMLRTS
jgi:hypothetical protein